MLLKVSVSGGSFHDALGSFLSLIYVTVYNVIDFTLLFMSHSKYPWTNIFAGLGLDWAALNDFVML